MGNEVIVEEHENIRPTWKVSCNIGTLLFTGWKKGCAQLQWTPPDDIHCLQCYVNFSPAPKMWRIVEILNRFIRQESHREDIVVKAQEVQA